MAADLAVVVFTVLVLLLVAILATRMRQDHWVILRLFESTAVTEILWHLVLCVGKLAVRTCPVIKSQEALHTSLYLRLFLTFVANVVHDTSLSLFLLVLLDVLLQTFVQLLNPSFDTT